MKDIAIIFIIFGSLTAIAALCIKNPGRLERLRCRRRFSKEPGKDRYMTQEELALEIEKLERRIKNMETIMEGRRYGH